MRQLPVSQRTCGAFTLVELLVVIAIISMLAALLLPSLEMALDQAKRLRCLNDRRQFGLIFNFWGNEHNGRVLTRVNTWVSQNSRIAGTQVSYVGNHSMLMSRGDITLDLGLMAARGYVDDPSLYFCPDFQRDTSQEAWGWDQGFPHVWRHMNDPSYIGYFGGRFETPTGVSNNFMVKGPWGADIWARGYTRENLTFAYIADNWAKSIYVSPMLQTCANYAAWGTPTQTYTDSAGVTRNSQPNDGPPAGGSRVSHGLKGVNAVFVDGSARWIDEREVTWTTGGGGHFLGTHYRLGGHLHVWGQKKATIAPPR